MSSSDLMIEMQEEAYYKKKADWIRRELGDSIADESTTGWADLENEFDLRFDGYDDYMMDEYEWHSNQNHSGFYVEFIHTIDDVKNILNSKIDPIVVSTVYKMVHVHVITAMETYLSDALKASVLSKKELINKAAIGLKELSEKRFSLEEIIQHPDGIRKIISDQLDEYLYHNIPKVMRIYRAALGITVRYNISRICKDTKIRHDIVHRNGKTITGEYVQVNNELLLETIEEVQKFILYIDSQLTETESDTPKSIYALSEEVDFTDLEADD